MSKRNTKKPAKKSPRPEDSRPDDIVDWPATSDEPPVVSCPLAAPPFRRLRVYAFDPTLGAVIETAELNVAALKVKWEKELKPGPVGEYLEVIDHDPASNCFYSPVDLNHPHSLAQDGLSPSEGNPQFHQQMVYAVAMTTIANFERALGRKALWAPRRFDPEGRMITRYEEKWVPRLRIYPHALREPNAYYSPEKKALLFGYFPASCANSPGSLPGGTVFTCLSHDIVAHETTHALLDGLHERFNEPSNPDVPAFHEAFADIVALFQHFTFPEAIRHQIAQTRGDLRRQNLLGALAMQFGLALGQRGALRDAIGSFDENDEWQPAEPNPAALDETEEPHARGAILVAAVFDAFLTIYRHRVADLLRIASGGSGILGDGELHPDLVNRLAAEATKSAQHVLLMCIRALDYCPPVDITFGEYLRALITADTDLVPDDDRNYRIAFIEAFRQRGIYPRDVRTLSVESLCWKPPHASARKVLAGILPQKDDQEMLHATWGLDGDRREIFMRNQHNAANLWRKMDELMKQGSDGGADLAGCEVTGLSLGNPHLRLEVHSVRPARRVGPDGQQCMDWIVEITQRRPAWFDADEQEANEKAYYKTEEEQGRGKGKPRPDFRFRAGCTLVICADTGEVRYAVYKNITSANRLERERSYRASTSNLFATYFSDSGKEYNPEPFAMLHREF